MKIILLRYSPPGTTESPLPAYADSSDPLDVHSVPLNVKAIYGILLGNYV